MPYRRKYGARKKMGKRGYAGGRSYRKKYGKKYRKSNSRGIARSLGVVFPQQMYKCLTYSTDPIKLAQSSSGTPATYFMKGNSCYDPDQTGLGGQPRWYDTFCGAQDGTAPYGKYQVNASKITVTIWQDPQLTGSSGSVAGLVTIIPLNGNGSNNAPDNFQEQMMRGFMKRAYINNANSSRPIVLKHFAKTKAVYTGNRIDDNTDFSGAYNSDPNKLWTWCVQANNVIDAGTGTQLFSCYISIRIKFYLKFWSLNDVNDS